MTAIRKVYFKIDKINKKSKGKGLSIIIRTKKDDETYTFILSWKVYLLQDWISIYFSS